MSPNAGASKRVRFKEEVIISGDAGGGEESEKGDGSQHKPFKPLKLFGMETNLKSVHETSEIPKRSPIKKVPSGLGRQSP